MEFLAALLPLASVLCLGVFVQSAAGFAAGLIIVPCLLLQDFSIAEAQAALLVATIPQNASGIWRFRDSITAKEVATPGITRVVFFPIGCFLLTYLQTFPMDRVRQVVGVVVLLITFAIISFKPRPRDSLHPAWAWIAFPISGVLQGLLGMGGPPMVFWVQAHDWSTRQTRGFMFSMYLISIAPALLVLYYYFGDVIVQPMIGAAATIPVLLVVTVLGLKFGDRLGRQRLRKVTYGLLILIGINGVLSPIIRPSESPESTNKAIDLDPSDEQPLSERN